MKRRLFLRAGVAGILACGLAAGHWFNVLGRNGDASMTPREVHAAALRGEILLIDIRRPDEWALTGVGEGASPLDMRRPDFIETLLALAGNDKSRPLALICARGVRSRHLASDLAEAGFVNIVDVPEGMLGSGAGPGWIGRSLPVIQTP
jgi:rhodanese-related sulfurtransferase